MSQTRTAAITLAAANPTAVCAAQTPAAAGALALNGASVLGGVGILDAARRILVTTTANETGKTLTLYGVDRGGNPIVELIALPNAATAYSIQDFLKVTSVLIGAPAAGSITVGTNGVASTRWILMDSNLPMIAATAAVNFGGVAGTVAVEVTLDPVNKEAVDRLAGTMDESVSGLPGSAFVPPFAFAAAGGTGLATDTLLEITTPVRAVRLTVSAGAATPGVRLTLLQQGVRA